MDNKLSELRKPVAYKFDHGVMGPGDFKYGTPQMHSAAKDENASPLYSQEYVSALLERIEELEVSEIKPEGLKLMIEAIGAHGYIVGCLVQGRPDLALEESRKWANAFSQEAEQSNG